MTRAQLATFLVRAYRYRTNTPSQPPASSPFLDTGDSVHHEAIAEAHALEFADGVAPGRFNPGGAVRRDQMASFVGRVVDRLVAEGAVSVPKEAAPQPSYPAPRYPAAPAGSWSYLATDDSAAPIRYNPCQPIPVVMNPSGAPAGAEVALKRALRQLRETSGLQVVYEGRTSERYSGPPANRQPYQPDRYGERWAPVLVIWGELDGFAGYGGATYLRSQAQPTFVTGYVVADPNRAQSSAAMEGLLLHELGHVAGLGHTDHGDEVMYPRMRGQLTYGRGDRAGLARVGRPAGCLPIVRTSAYSSASSDSGMSGTVTWHRPHR